MLDMCPRSLFIHAGLHKTGTTAIQAALASNSNWLSTRGYEFPLSGQLPEGGGQHNLAWEMTDDRRFRPEYGVSSDLAKEVGAGHYNVILSSEDFTGALVASDRFSKFLEETRNLFEEVCVIVFLRNQVDYAVSLYIELLKHGFDMPFGGYLDEISTTGALRWREWFFPFDFLQFLSRVSKLEGVRLRVCSYELSKHALLEVFLRACEVSGVESNSLPAPGENTRLSPGSYVSHFLRNRSSSPTDPNQELSFAYIQRIWNKKSIGLTARDQQFIAQTFKDSNERLSSVYGVPLNEFMPPPNPSCQGSESVAISSAFSVELQDVFEQLSMKFRTEMETANACRKTLTAKLEAALNERDSLAAQLQSIAGERGSSVVPFGPVRPKGDSSAARLNTISDTHTKVASDVNSVLHPRSSKLTALLRRVRLLFDA
jgi:hypothetical protein